MGAKETTARGETINVREAESVLLDRRYFALSEEAFQRFTKVLDSPPKDNPKLRRLLQTKAPWDR